MPLPRLPDKYVTVNGLRIRYLDAGAGRPIVLVHALGVQSCAESWLVNFDGLGKLGHVYALDLPGWGLSDPPADGHYTFPLWVETVKGFCDALKLDQVDIVGMSLGGWTTALFAHQHPQLVRRVALLSNAGLNPTAPLSPSSFALPTRDAVQRAYPEAATADEIYRRMQLPGREAAYRALLTYVSDPKVREQWGLRTRLPQMQMPILFAQADNNRAIPVQYALEGFTLAPLARLAVMVGAGTGGYNGPEFERAVVAFLTAEQITPAK